MHTTSDAVQQAARGRSVFEKRPPRTGLISNPDSGQNRRGMHAINALVAQYRGVLHYKARNPSELSTALRELARQGVELLVINGGDGTVQATLTLLLDRSHFDELPLLAVLAGGTTNMTAGDVGVKGTPTRALTKILSWANMPGERADLVDRPVLRIQRRTDPSPLFGMFFGAGAIVRGIEYCHRRIHGLGFRNGIAPGICTLRILADMVRRAPRFVAPVPVKVQLKTPEVLPERLPQERDLLLLLVSTLERLFLGIRPYWGDQRGELYYTEIKFRPTHALRAIPPLFWGRPNRAGTPENGYVSHKVDELHLTMDGEFTLDGELYEVNSGTGPVHITKGGQVSFVRF